MSRLVVEVCEIERIEEHPNAEKLEISLIKGWRTCTRKGEFRAGQKVVFIPPDSVLPGDLADRLKVTPYLGSLPKSPDGTRPAGGKVRVAKLRGERSYGLIMDCEDPSLPTGLDVAERYGITKWEPPENQDGQSERAHPAFFRYTDIENYRNFPNLIPDGEEVVFTEKLHGKNTRLGYIRDEDGYKFMVGSHNFRRKEFTTFNKKRTDPMTGEEFQEITTVRSQFWKGLTEPVQNLLREVSGDQEDVILFVEMIGLGVQDMTYGTELDFRAYDLMVGGKYLDFDEKAALFHKYGVNAVPVLYRGPFSRAKLEEFVDGPTTICTPEKAGAFKGREGVVITPTKERTDPDLGRVILKAVSFNYLDRKGGTEHH